MQLVRRNALIKRLKTCLRNYVKDTTFHGFRYIIQPNSSKFKSYFWSVICFISTCLCIILIHWQFKSYNSNRIATTISTISFPIWEVPFPAVTLCNLNQVYRDNIEQFRPILAKIDSDRFENFFSNLSLLVSSTHSDDEFNEDFDDIIGILDEAGITTDKLMEKLAQPCSQLLTTCYWNSKELNCEEIFHTSKTNGGYCCSFNYKNIIDNDDIITYNKNEIYVPGIGPSFGLEVYLNTEMDQYISPTKQNYGIDVVVHQTEAYPDMAIYSVTVYPGSELSLAVKPEIVESDERVRKLDLTTRKCAFKDEIKLEWAKSYTYTSCMSECKAKAIIELCGCVPFYYPLIVGGVKYCTLSDLSCMKHESIPQKTSLTAYDFFQTDHQTIKKKNMLSCQCYTQCNVISYSYQIDQRPNTKIESQSNTSILRVYFSHISCMKISRNVFITWELILASIGGLIGLCLGGSILSIIEFFYCIIEALMWKPQTKPTTGSNETYNAKLYLSDFPRTKATKFTRVTTFDKTN